MDTKTQFLADEIAAARRIPADMAQFLAEYVISGDYTGGALYVGIGDLSFSTRLYAVVYPAGGRWYIITGYRMPDGRLRLENAAHGQTAKGLRHGFCFEHDCDYFAEVTPDLPPEDEPNDPDTEPDLPIWDPELPDVLPGAYPDEPVLPDLLPAYPENEPGTVYVLMLDEPLGSQYHRAQFYCGWTKNLTARLDHHRAGRGSCFTRAAVERGIGFKLVYAMPGTRADERCIKNQKGVQRWLQARGVELPGQAVQS